MIENTNQRDFEFDDVSKVFSDNTHYFLEFENGPLQPDEIYTIEIKISEKYWITNPEYDENELHGFGSPSRIIEGGTYETKYWTSCRDEESLIALKPQMDKRIFEQEFNDPKIKELYNTYVPYVRKIIWYITKKHFFQTKK